MAAKKTKALAGLLAPKEVGLNRDTNLLKLVAMISMLIDHTGKMFFPQYRIMRIIGRLAFPLYAYCIAVGGVYSKNKLKYLSRILLMGLISQPFYAVALAHTVPAMYAVRFADNPLGAVMNFYVQSWAVPNIMLTLALGLMLIWSLREGQYVCALSVALLVWKAQNAVNYGWRGVALIALFYLTISHWWVSLPVMSAYMLWWGSQGASYHMFGASFGIQMFAILALPLVYIPTWSKLRINKWVYYLFYPAHLIGIMLIEFALKQ
ncbi:MAG: hypothetical protein IJH25_00900 [Clostridia bacterium]|nr:hypothetical protein [Clostridia bacterium]MBQ6122061.1 hypothetical protein [Clostridia bacterium]MBQ8963912.1 hypothetical protein [Clostridia bacterium]MBQ9039533.1 hypothetical protein [Clostridia bacterium]